MEERKKLKIDGTSCKQMTDSCWVEAGEAEIRAGKGIPEGAGGGWRAKDGEERSPRRWNTK